MCMQLFKAYLGSPGREELERPVRPTLSLGFLQLLGDLHGEELLLDRGQAKRDRLDRCTDRDFSKEMSVIRLPSGLCVYVCTKSTYASCFAAVLRGEG